MHGEAKCSGGDRVIDATLAWGAVATIPKHLNRHFEAGAIPGEENSS